ncbi:MAG: Mo-dependent nitrogenase C-terminal domain-containing protein [Xenococcaceae cyanobacterium]
MNVTENSEKNLVFIGSYWKHQHQGEVSNRPSSKQKKFAPLRPIRQFLDEIEIDDRFLAHFVCQLIPSQCPFERKIEFRGRQILHSPPMCKLNPFYEQLVSLRFRAMCYLADRCGEDVSNYC